MSPQITQITQTKKNKEPGTEKIKEEDTEIAALVKNDKMRNLKRKMDPIRAYPR